jgi:hypothetical protein
MSKEQYSLWERGFGFPVYGRGDRMVEFFVDQEGLEREDAKKEGKMSECGCGMRGGEGAELQAEHHQCAGDFLNDGPLVVYGFQDGYKGRRIFHYVDRANSYTNRFFPHAGGSFEDGDEYMKYLKSLSKHDHDLVAYGKLSIADRPPKNWVLIEGSRLEGQGDEEKWARCYCTSGQCGGCYGCGEDGQWIAGEKKEEGDSNHETEERDEEEDDENHCICFESQEYTVPNPATNAAQPIIAPDGKCPNCTHPDCLFGFLCKTKTEWEPYRQALSEDQHRKLGDLYFGKERAEGDEWSYANPAALKRSVRYKQALKDVDHHLLKELKRIQRRDNLRKRGVVHQVRWVGGRVDRSEDMKRGMEGEEEEFPCCCTCEECENCQGSEQDEQVEEVGEIETEDEEVKDHCTCFEAEHSSMPTLSDLTPLMTRERFELECLISNDIEELLTLERYMRYMLDARKLTRSPKPMDEQVVVVQQLPPLTHITILMYSPTSQSMVVHAHSSPPQVVLQAPYSPPHPTPSPIVRAPRTSSTNGDTHQSLRMYIHERASHSPHTVQVLHSAAKDRISPPTHTERVRESITENNEKRTPSVISYNTRKSTASSQYPPYPYVEDAIDSPKPAPRKAPMLSTPSGMTEKLPFPVNNSSANLDKLRNATAKVSSPRFRGKLPIQPEQVIVPSSSPCSQVQPSRLPPLSTQQYCSLPLSRFCRNVRLENEGAQQQTLDKVDRGANQGARRSAALHAPPLSRQEGLPRP